MFLTVLAACAISTSGAKFTWTQLPSLPDTEGFAGMYAGVSQGYLVAAGGAKFPDKRPWEGGTKVWYDSIYSLGQKDKAWRLAGKLPKPLGYGVSVTYGNAIICAGGSDKDVHYADCFKIELKNGIAVTTPLPPLPMPLANGCGALDGSKLYVIGGQASPTSTDALFRVFVMDLKANKLVWSEIAPIPGPGRILASTTVYKSKLYICGGASLYRGADGLAKRIYLNDAYVYSSKSGWKTLATMPYPVVATPTPLPVDGNGFYVLGGDDGSLVGVPQVSHPGFVRTVLHYSVRENKWTVEQAVTAPRVTAPCVRWNDGWAVISGEARPGVRSPEVWSVKVGS